MNIKHLPRKLILSMGSLLLGLVLLVTASFAWLTVSEAPETSGIHMQMFSDYTLLLSTDGVNFSESLDLSQAFADYVGLRPVSTADGINWFLASYDADDTLASAEDFVLDDTLEHANVSGVDENGDPLTGEELLIATNRGYYMYTDIWLKTELDEGCTVRLSIPHEGAVSDWTSDAGVQGSYVLQTYELKVSDQGQVVADVSNDAQTAVRIGFLVNPSTYRDGSGNIVSDPGHNENYTSDDFYIYEPNADSRSSSNKSEASYVIGYGFNSSVYQDGNYIITCPITKITAGEIYQVPITDGLSGELIFSEMGSFTDSYSAVKLDPSHLIIQRTSSWNQAALETAILAGEQPDSNDVATMGTFMHTSMVYSAAGTGNYAAVTSPSGSALSGGTSEGGDPYIVDLQHEEPVKVRIFIWLEGQDVDCWNDISSGAFRVNLELAGKDNTDPE